MENDIANETVSETLHDTANEASNETVSETPHDTFNDASYETADDPDLMMALTSTLDRTERTHDPGKLDAHINTLAGTVPTIGSST